MRTFGIRLTPLLMRTATARLFVFLWILSLGACTETQKKETPPPPPKPEPKKQVNVPTFLSDSAFYFIEKQLEFGPRVPNTQGHQICGDYLIEALENYGAAVTVQSFTATAWDGTKLEGRNIVGSINPSASRRILLAAHWDTRPYADQDIEVKHHEPILGANDGASGVAVLLEIARAVHRAAEKPEVGIDIMFFDLEDYGAPAFSDNRQPDTYCLGSQHWGKTPHVPNYSAYYGILLDMVGGKDARFGKEGYSREYAPKIVEKVWRKGAELGHDAYFVYQETQPIIDDHLYVNKLAGIPMIDIIQFDDSTPHYFGPYWHKHDDNLELVSKETLQAVGETVLHVLYYE